MLSPRLLPLLLCVGGQAVLSSGTESTAALSFLTQPNAGAAFTGGFGGAGSAAKGKKAGSKKNTKKIKPNKRVSHESKVAFPDIISPEGRMAHIAQRIESADFSSLAKLALIGGLGSERTVLDIDPNAICVVDDFLGPGLLAAMKTEAESLLPTMVPSMSTRWDDESQKVVAYEKHRVMSTQIEGGAEGYAASPRLVEYIVTLTQYLSRRLNSILPQSYHLSGQEQTNKLAVCLGDGSKYDKHIDNLGGGDGKGDRRKLTALLYLQPPDSHVDNYPNEKAEDDPRGGYFRAFDVPEEGQLTPIAPKGDRLLLFWSDSLVHDVSPSYAPHGNADQRWALTTWLLAKEGGTIKTTDSTIEDRHFGRG